ncbi:MAG: hypothetical protein DWP95_05450 [Proteobacteria bacterium]|nr:MAG: hypothetical protein DWP95_05450 [Pseudomonadota bacterium]
MKKLVLLSLLALMLAACGDKESEQPAAVKSAMAEADILSYVPADTPLFFASGLSNDLYPDRYISVMQDNMKNIAEYLKLAFSDINQSMQQVDQGQKVGSAEELNGIEQFIDRWMIDGQFSKLGVKVGESQLVGYTVDLFPVIRMQLAGGHQIADMFADLDQQFALSPQVQEQDGLSIREYSVDKITVLAAHSNDYLVLSLAPSVIKDKLVNSLTGIDKPAQNMAQNQDRLNEIKTKHGFVVDDMFVMDVQAIADYFINPDNYDSALLDFLQIEDNKLSPVCKTEINSMLAKAPRLVAGATALTDKQIDSAFIWEMDTALSQDMAQLAGRIPAIDESAAFSFGMSVDILNSQKVLTKYIENIINEPYQCELFTQLNQQAEALKLKISQPLPPFVSNFKGFNMAFSDLKVNEQAANLNKPAEMIESFKMQLALSVDEAQSLVGMAQMMLPQLQGMALPTDGSLIPLKEQLPPGLMNLPVDISSAYAAINNQTIGLSLGYPGGGNLSDVVNQEGQHLLFSATADAAGYKQIIEEIFKLADMPLLSEDMKRQLESQKQMTLTMLYWKQQKVTMNFTDQGLTTHMAITY